jgi:hypothetical protein
MDNNKDKKIILLEHLNFKSYSGDKKDYFTNTIELFQNDSKLR